MLYVFRMDVGQMLTVDMSFLMDSVAKLCVEIARITNIPPEKQILLVSGGHSLKPEQKVMSYGAGADTNPVFLFSKMAIEKQEPPIVRANVTKDTMSALKDSFNKVMSMPPQIESVSLGTKIACQFRDSAIKILNFCKNEFKEQHLQYQGWGTVVANLEEIVQSLQHSKVKFSKAIAAFLPVREQYFYMLDNFVEVMELLQRIPLVKALVDESGPECVTTSTRSALPLSKSHSVVSSHGSFITSTSFRPSTLLDWITTQGQGQSLETLRHKCYDELLMFDSELFERLNQGVDEVLTQVNTDPHKNKELIGIERRLSHLEKLYIEATKIAEEQNDVTQNFFLKHSSSLSKTGDVASILPDLCQAHKHQLRQMIDRHQRMEALQLNFVNSKQEMSTNIHQRLSWVMHVETNISGRDNDLIFHMKSLKILECNMELLSQVKVAPKVYADIVVETARRRDFSSKFAQWAESLAEDSTHLYKTETERRNTFAKNIGDHFLLDTLFKGFNDMPPGFATKAPSRFDRDLPEITLEDMDLLWSAAPELKESLRVSVDGSLFPLSYPGKERTDSPFAHIMFPTSQSSQTEWEEQPSVVKATPFQPSVVKATEAPPTKFTLPELAESTATHLPRVSASQPHQGTRQAGIMTSGMAVGSISSSRARNCRSPDQSVPPSISTRTVAPLATETLPSVQSSRPGPLAANDAPQSSVSAGRYGRAPHPTSATSPTDRLATSPPHTESTSPPSSNEFATADFYFEDSIPSPLASSSEKQSSGSDNKKGGDSSEKTLVASLQAELASRDTLIQDLEEKLREHHHQHHQQQHASLSDNSITVAPSLSQSDAASSTPPMEDALDISLVVGSKCEPLTPTGEAQLEQLQQSLEQVTSDLSRAKLELLQSKRLRQDLEQANVDLAKAKDNLLESEVALSEKEEENKRVLQDKDRLIHDLKSELDSARCELDQTVSAVAVHEKTVHCLKEEAQTFKVRTEKLEEEVCSGQESLRQVKAKLVTVRDSLISGLSPLRRDMMELRSSVVSNEAELQTTLVSTINSVQKEVSRFCAQAAESAQTEKDALYTEIQQLKARLHLAESSAAEQTVHLKSVQEDCGIQLGRQEEVAAQRLSDARVEFEAKLRDQATKHALELELELERCGTELKEKENLLARHAEELANLRERSERNLREARHEAGEEQERLALAYSNNLRQAEESNAREMQASAARLRKEFEAESEAALEMERRAAEDRLKQCQHDQEAVILKMEHEKEESLRSLKDQLEKDHEGAASSLREQLAREHQGAMTDLKEQLGRQHEGDLTELRAQIVELKESMTHALEQTQLEHANKLTQLKTEFDHERENLQRELSCYKDRSMADSSTETDFTILGLHHVCGQTQTEEQKEKGSGETAADGGDMKMATSETQTDINLLAEVISLNSSISYGSEEMIANKLMASSPVDDKDNKAGKEPAMATTTGGSSATANSRNTQETIDDLNLQLACAQEKIASLNEEIRSLRDRVKETGTLSPPLRPELSLLSSPEREGAIGARAREMVGSPQAAGYLDMMASSSTAASFILMEGDQQPSSEEKQVDPPGEDKNTDPQIIKSKDEQIAQLERKLKDASSDKVSIRGCDRSDIVLLCLDENHDQYVVFTVGTYLHFLHSESLEVLGLKSSGDSRCKKSWILAEVVDKEFCLAKKANNRFRVPQGTCFYRVKCKPWKSDKSEKGEGDHHTDTPGEQGASRGAAAGGKQGSKAEHGTGARSKKSKDGS